MTWRDQVKESEWEGRAPEVQDYVLLRAGSPTFGPEGEALTLGMLVSGLLASSQSRLDFAIYWGISPNIATVLVVYVMDATIKLW